MAQSAKTTADTYLDVVHIILGEGYEIVKLKDQAFNANHMDGKKNSDPVLLKVNRYIDQGQVYDHIERWFKNTEETFKKCALNYPKLLANTHLKSNRGTDPLFLMEKFELAMQEMSKISGNIDYLKTYLTPAVRELFSQAIINNSAIYAGGTITQGAESHTFTKANYIGLINFLWPLRKITNTSTGKTIPGTPKSKAAVKKATGIAEDELKKIAIGMNQVLSKKGISVGLYRPDYVYIEVTESS